MTRVNTGIQFEYKIRDYFKAKGFQVIRSAGSHGSADLIVWKDEDVILIQCKKEVKKKSYEKDIMRLAATPAPKSWKKLLWIKRKKEIFIHDVYNFGVEVMSIRDINKTIRAES